MPQPRFDSMSDRLLRAGVAPRHVRRYVSELRDHFDDLLREGLAKGEACEAAEKTALSRLGEENDLAEIMLTQPGLRSLAARLPWAVFGLGPAVIVVATLALGLAVEIGVLDLVSAQMHATGFKAGPAFLGWFTLAIEVWNTFIIDIAPIAVAVLLCIVGIRQKISPAWIVSGAAIAGFLGGFQYLSWYDTGMRGELTFNSGLLPPFAHFAVGLEHAAANLVVVGATAWWLAARRGLSFWDNKLRLDRFANPETGRQGG